MDYSKNLVRFTAPRPDRKAERFSKCWKDVSRRKYQHKRMASIDLFTRDAYELADEMIAAILDAYEPYTAIEILMTA